MCARALLLPDLDLDDCSFHRRTAPAVLTGQYPWAAGMYFYERAWHSLRGLSGKAAAAARKSVQNNEAQQKQPATVLERMSAHTNAEAPPTSR